MAARQASPAASFAPSFLKKGSEKLASISELKFQPGPYLAPSEKPVQISGREYLPANWQPNLPENLAMPRENFPPVVELESSSKGKKADMATWARAVKPHLDAALAEHGCVVAAGMPVSNAEDFAEFMKTIKLEDQCDTFMTGRSMTSTNVASNVRTGSDDDNRYTIEPHHEYNVASANRPRKLWLIVGEEATEGGEWLLTDSKQILAEMDKDVLQKFERLGVRYEVYYPSQATPNFYNCWEENIACTRQGAEEYLVRAGCDWTWNDEDNSLLIHRVLPATVPHPVTNEKVWFNQLHAHHKTFYQGCHPDFEADWGNKEKRWPVHTLYGDGTEIEDEALEHVRELVWKHTVGIPLKMGHLFVVDNYRVMHGRMGYPQDSPRQTLVSITYQ